MIETWVNDKLHDIMGISDKLIAQYMIGLATKSSSIDNFIEKLKDTGTIEVDANVEIFARELWGKVSIVSESFSRLHIASFNSHYDIFLFESVTPTGSSSSILVFF